MEVDKLAYRRLKYIQMISGPTIQQTNAERYLELIQTFDPDLYLTKQALLETGVNPLLLPRIIRGMANIAHGTGYGKVQIFIENRKVSQIKPEESDQVDLMILVDSITTID